MNIGILKKIYLLKFHLGEINEVYDEAIKSGALGGKLLGSGGGGFFIFYVPTNNQIKLRKKLNKLEEVDFSFSNEGSSIIFNNE